MKPRRVMAGNSRGVLDPASMPHDRLDATIADEVSALRQSGTAKGSEAVIVGIERERDGHGPRYLLAGAEQRFIRMNSNSYLGLSRHPVVIEAEESQRRSSAPARERSGSSPGPTRHTSTLRSDWRHFMTARPR